MALGVERLREATRRVGTWMSGAPGPDALRDGALVLAVARSLVLGFLFPFVAWLDAPHKWAVFLVIGAATVGHVAFIWLYLIRERPLSFAVAQATVLLDTIAIGAGVALTGGATSAGVIIWAPNLAVGAVWIGVRAMVPALAVVTAELVVLAATGYAVDEVRFTTAQTATVVSFMLVMLVAVGGLVTQRQRQTMRALDAAEARARRDPLTGLLNRTAIEERLGEELTRARRYGSPVSLLMLDLDDFKALNDRRGHLVGDLALLGVAQVLMREKRTSDVAARLGGEEFLVLLPETGQAEAVVIAERFRERIAAESASGETVTVSVGVATFPDQTRTPVELTMAADIALYAAKAAGKNRVSTYDPSVHEPIGSEPGDPGWVAALARHATTIAANLGMDMDEMQAVRTAALMHALQGMPISDPLIVRILDQAKVAVEGEHREREAPRGEPH